MTKQLHCFPSQLVFYSSINAEVEKGHIFVVNRSNNEILYHCWICTNYITFEIHPNDYKGRIRMKQRRKISIHFRPRYDGIYHSKLAILSSGKITESLNTIDVTQDEAIATAVELMQLSRFSRSKVEFAVSEQCLDFTPTSEDIGLAMHSIKQSINAGSEQADFLLRRILTVTNNSFDGVELRWRTPALLDQIDNHTYAGITTDPHNPFIIRPLQSIITPGSIQRFEVTFLPDTEDRFHQFFEATAFPVDSDNKQLLSTVGFECYGSTLHKERLNQLMNHYFKVSRSQLRVGPMQPGQRSFEVIFVQNTGPDPLLVDQLVATPDEITNGQSIVDSSRLGVHLLPRMQLIQPNSHAAFVVEVESIIFQQQIKELLASKQGSLVEVKQSIQLRFNQSNEYIHSLPIAISMAAPWIEFETDNTLSLKPTNVIQSSTTKHSIRNKSPYKLGYSWKISPSDSEQLSIEPQSGLLEPYQEQTQAWTFQPSSIGEQHFHAYLSYESVKHSLIEPCLITKELTVLAFADNVQLVFEPWTCNDPVVPVGESKFIVLSLNNSGSVSADCHVKVDVGQTGEETVQTSVNCRINTQPTSFVISANCKIPVTIEVSPLEEGSFSVIVTCEVKNYGNIPDADIKPISTEVIVHADYPHLNIIDICGGGLMELFSPVELWRDLDIDATNKSLEIYPSPQELSTRASGLKIFQDDPNFFTPVGSSVDLLVGTGPAWLDNKSKLCLTLQNQSLIATTFTFLFPSDRIVKLPVWADSNLQELDCIKVERSNLFRISLKSATLKPKECIRVCLTFSHQDPGQFRLPILLKIDNGRELTINLKGQTLPKAKPYLHFPRRFIRLPSLALKQIDPIAGYSFRLPLFNLGDQLVAYRVDLDLCQYNENILQCINDRGIVAPKNGSSLLQFKFVPLEARLYETEFAIYIRDANVSNEATNSNERLTFRFEAEVYHTVEIGSQQVEISPRFGTIKSGQSVQIQIKLSPKGSLLGLMEIDLVCQVYSIVEAEGKLTDQENASGQTPDSRMVVVIPNESKHRIGSCHLTLFGNIEPASAIESLILANDKIFISSQHLSAKPHSNDSTTIKHHEVVICMDVMQKLLQTLVQSRRFQRRVRLASSCTSSEDPIPMWGCQSTSILNKQNVDEKKFRMLETTENQSIESVEKVASVVRQQNYLLESTFCKSIIEEVMSKMMNDIVELNNIQT